jgi:shikimate kinase
MASTITFIGYRGSGKSAVGAVVARRLGWSFVDADVEIERRAGQTIREIFAAGGEPAFRSLEEDVLKELLTRAGTVISAGGGAILSAATRERMRSAGYVVFLKVSPEVAFRRIASDATTAERRPPLTSLPARDEIERTMTARMPLYEECATITLDADAATISDLAEAVLQAVPAVGRETVT